ncbi:MAG: glycine cleavage system protein GcvH [Syntrophales bacterium]|jgi:glycine cleavage system H protein|nr:glycine cleavage system protein GcvH [Syntrophales bacterium]NLN60616.1 glycine cleavage system protein GcvH [Deltaproteobacteria bacterium]
MTKSNPDDRRYTKEHEWALDNGDGTITMGITDHAQHLLTDIVYVELPDVGKKVKQMDPVAVIESVKSVSDIYSPVSGEVAAVNDVLQDKPELVNEDAFGVGWIVKITMSDPAELDSLMNAAAYTALTATGKDADH